MRVKTLFLAFLAATAAIGTGCKHPPSGPTLSCLGWGDPEEMRIIQAAVDEFKKVHPGVEVELQRVPYNDYIAKVLTEFSSGTQPDVMAVNAEQMVAFSSHNMLVDLKPFVDKDPNLRLKDFYPEALDHYTVDGRLIALPRDIAPIAVIYYNKKEFDEAGVPYPKNNWTTEEFLATAKKLTKKGAGGRTLQYGFIDDWPMWDSWVYAFGGSLTDDEKKPTRCTLDSPQAVAGVQFRADLILVHHVTPGPSNITAMGGMGNSDFFMNGTAAMFYSGIWKTPYLRGIKNFEWDAVEFPKGSGGHRGFPMSAAGYGIVKDCKNQQLAYELVKYLAGATGQTLMAATGLTQPALKTLAKSDVFLDGQSPKSKAFLVDAVKDGHFWPYDANVQEWKNMVDSALDRAWTGDETVESILKKVTAKVNEKFYKK